MLLARIGIHWSLSIREIEQREMGCFENERKNEAYGRSKEGSEKP
jgi:hypothetical protein